MWKKLIAVAAIAVIAGAAGAVVAFAADGAQQSAPSAVSAPDTTSRAAATATSQVFRVAANANGTKAYGSKGTYVAKQGGSGGYEVGFPKDVSSCVGVASIADNQHDIFIPPAGMASVAYRDGNPYAFWVETRNGAGTATDLDFTLIVTCKAPRV